MLSAPSLSTAVRKDRHGSGSASASSHGGALREMTVEHLGEQHLPVREEPVQRRNADPGEPIGERAAFGVRAADCAGAGGVDVCADEACRPIYGTYTRPIRRIPRLPFVGAGGSAHG